MSVPSAAGLPRIVFAGDRQIGVDVLRFLLDQGVHPLGLMLPEPAGASHSPELLAMCGHLVGANVWYGAQFQAPQTIDTLRALDLDYIICAQFPNIVRHNVLSIPKEGVLNLHPAYLPYSRGWHPSIWALLKRTPYGATLHFMDEGVDTGDIVYQKAVTVKPEDTGNTLYRQALALELEVFKEAWPQLVDRSYTRRPQGKDSGTAHRRADLDKSGVREIDPDALVRAGDLIDKLRGLTTNRVDEAAYFVANGKRYRVQVQITPEEE